MYFNDYDKNNKIDNDNDNNTSYNFFVSGTVSSFNSKWLEKAYQRAKDQAQEEGKSVDAVVAERWGVCYMLRFIGYYVTEDLSQFVILLFTYMHV